MHMRSDRYLGVVACRSRPASRAAVRVVAVLAMLAPAGFSPAAAPARAAESCANEAIRAEQGAVALALPDCRAYEMVSPPGSVPVRLSSGGKPVAAVDGQRFGYYSFEPYPGSNEEGLYLLATRDESGWSVQNVIPPQGGVYASDQIACFPSVVYSEELTSAVLIDGWRDGDEVCEGDDPPLSSDEPRGYANLFLRDNEDSSYQLIDELPAGQAPANALVWDVTPDDRVVFSEQARLTPEASVGLDLYEWDGSDRLVSVLPDGEPVAGTLANSLTALYTHPVSASGETVFFYYGGDLYARLHATREPASSSMCGVGGAEGACTVQIDAAQPGASGAGGNGMFMDASEDGSRVFFTDASRLTSDSTAFSNRPDLYEYDLETGSLTDLTVDSSDFGADVFGYTGASADGSYLYFVAKGALTGGQTNGEGETAVAFQPNLYLRHEGVTTFVATLSGADSSDWAENGSLTARVSPDGRYLIFESVEPLTGYDNQPLEPRDCEKSCHEVFLYDAVENELSCVSCAASGEPPSGPSEISYPTVETLTPESPSYLQRNVLDDGQVFFDSRTPLVGQAVNGEVNVYEYENGSVDLISSGAGSGASEFLDASASGQDVFFSTAQGLVQGDTDNQTSVYDARVDGGFPPGSGETQQVMACEGAEACKPPASESPAQLFPASTALSGSGNLAAPPVPLTPSSPVTEAPPGKGSLTRVQKLARALRACAERPRAKRAACRAAAQRRFGVVARKQHERSGKPQRKAGRLPR